MAGAVLGEVQVSRFKAGAVLGEVQVSLFLAGAIFGEFGKIGGAQCCIFQYKMLVASAKSNLGCTARCGLTGSCSDRPGIVNDVSAVFSKFLSDFGRSLRQAQNLVRLEGDTC